MEDGEAMQEAGLGEEVRNRDQANSTRGNWKHLLEKKAQGHQE